MRLKKTVSEIEPSWLTGRSVLVRADYNVPVKDRYITDDRRIQLSLPTLELLLGAGAKVILLSHLGRPGGRVVPELSLAPVVDRLGSLLGMPIEFITDTDPSKQVSAAQEASSEQLLMLENTRFNEGDLTNDSELAMAWARLGELFVNDAFGTTHRAHASTSGLAQAMVARGHEAVSGLLVARELRFLDEALRTPDRPLTAVLGGAKISGKIDVIDAFLSQVDRLLVGGAMANTFMRALGFETGSSLVEENSVELAAELITKGADQLVLPVDFVVAKEIKAQADTRVLDRSKISMGDRIVDIGPKTRAHFTEVIEWSKSIVWNGPMGVFEIESFSKGTIEIAHAVADACDRGSLGIIGGGDSGAAVEKAGVASRVTHVSTGGGASLKLFSGATLPGIESLTNR